MGRQHGLNPCGGGRKFSEEIHEERGSNFEFLNRIWRKSMLGEGVKNVGEKIEVGERALN